MIFRRLSDRAAVEQDAARLVEAFGEAAFSKAGDLSFREDAGLVTSPSPGHWHRVQQEIGRREVRPPLPTPPLHALADRAVREQSGGPR